MDLVLANMSGSEPYFLKSIADLNDEGTIPKIREEFNSIAPLYSYYRGACAITYKHYLIADMLFKYLDNVIVMLKRSAQRAKDLLKQPCKP